MARRRPPLRPLTTLVLVLAALLAGCSGTPLGEGLSRSFPGGGGTEPADTAAGAGDPTAAAPATADAPAPSGPTSAQPAAGDSAASPATATDRKPAPPQGQPARPAAGGGAAAAVPYRLVLRLPQADPAAPAEVVTDALRAAGVSFEVETIERLSGGGDAAKAGAKPPAAEGDGEAAGAETRPAPEPR